MPIANYGPVKHAIRDFATFHGIEASYGELNTGVKASVATYEADGRSHPEAKNLAWSEVAAVLDGHTIGEDASLRQAVKAFTEAVKALPTPLQRLRGDVITAFGSNLVE